jgi:hypothetical protein
MASVLARVKESAVRVELCGHVTRTNVLFKLNFINVMKAEALTADFQDCALQDVMK